MASHEKMAGVRCIDALHHRPLQGLRQCVDGGQETVRWICNLVRIIGRVELVTAAPLYCRGAPLNRHAANSVRLCAPKRLHRLATCSFTVWSEIPISRAISLLVRPRQTRIATSAERGGNIAESAAAETVAGSVRSMIGAPASSSIC